jgi:hypothetical protein
MALSWTVSTITGEKQCSGLQGRFTLSVQGGMGGGVRIWFPFQCRTALRMGCWCGFIAVPAARTVSNENPAIAQNSKGFPQTPHLQDYFVRRLWLSSRGIEVLLGLDSGANWTSCSGREQKKTKIPRAYGPQGFSCLSAAPMESHRRNPMVKRQ